MLERFQTLCLSKIFLFVVVFIFSFLILYRVDRSFVIKEVKVYGEIEDEPLNAANDYLGRRIWKISKDKVRSHLKEANPFYKISDVDFQKPSTMIVKVQRYYPIAVLEFEEGQILLSKDGVVLEKNREKDYSEYPKIKFYQKLPYNNFQAGYNMNYKEILDSLYFLQVVQESDFLKINRIDIQGFNMIGLFTDKVSYLFTSDKDLEKQKYQFEESFRRLKIEGIDYKELDLRFDKPIVRL